MSTMAMCAALGPASPSAARKARPASLVSSLPRSLRTARRAPPRAGTSRGTTPRAFLRNMGIFKQPGANDPATDSDDEQVVDQSTVNPVAQPGRKLRDYTEVAYLTGRAKVVNQHFPTALGIDDFIHRLEIALYAYGFNGDNSIAMVNLCRDEITVSLKNKIDQCFGSSFNTNGLGGVLTCGVTGVAAGLSHAPVSKGSGKERYVFFSFPHISVDARGNVGAISRPGRPGNSCACGALNKALIDIKAEGVDANCKVPGVHEPLDPEMSILKQRLARRLRYDGMGDKDMEGMDLVGLTKVAEKTISDDLNYLISQTVDPQKADYAVVTGIQIHSWGPAFDDESPNLEFIAPATAYVVVNGCKTSIDLNAMPSLTPRQIRILADSARVMGGGQSASQNELVCNSTGSSTLREIDPPYNYSSKEIRARKREMAGIYTELIQSEGLRPEVSCQWPGWQSNLRVDEEEDVARNSAEAEHTSFMTPPGS